MSRLEELEEIFKGVDKNIKTLVDPLIEEVIFLEDEMTKLKTIPFLRINPKDPSQQKATPASKQYKEFSQSYMNAIRILSSLLNKQDTSAQDELLKRLAGFKIWYLITII